MSEEDEPVIASDGSERVKGRQKDGATPARELWRVVVIGIPVLVAAWYILQTLMRR